MILVNFFSKWICWEFSTKFEPLQIVDVSYAPIGSFKYLFDIFCANVWQSCF